MSHLAIHDREGTLLRTIEMTQDSADPTWFTHWA